MSDRKVLLIHETVLQSWLRDASTLALFLALIGIGWLFNSEPMQWVGACVGFTFTLTQAKRGEWCCTIPEARNRLDELEAKT